MSFTEGHMGLFASAFKRAALLSVTVYVLAILFAAAQLMPRYTSDALQTLGAAFHPESLVALAISTALFALWLMKGQADPFAPRGDFVARLARIFLGAFAIALCAISVLVLTGALFRGLSAILWSLSHPQTLIRMGFALMMAAAIVRMALPLLPRSDRMTTHNE